MPTISVMYPVQPDELGTARPYVRIAEDTSTRRLWCGQSLRIDTHHMFAALAGMGAGVAFGSAVTLMPLRHPLTAAMCARSVATISGEPFIAGIGPAAVSLQKAMLGTPYQKPIMATRQYVRMMRAFLAGEVVAGTSDPWPTTGVSLTPLRSPQVEIGLGVLRRPMASLAGEVADWGLTWLTPPHYVRDVLAPAIKEGAVRTGRPVPRIATVVHCAITRPGRDLADVAFHAAGQHIRLPHYVDMLNQSGVPVNAADPRAGASLLIKHGVIATGSPQDIADTIATYHAAGVDEVIVNVVGIHQTAGPGTALKDLTTILAAIER